MLSRTSPAANDKICLPALLRQRWPLGILVLLAGLVTPTAASGQGLRLLGIPLDTILTTKVPRVNAAYVTTYYGRLHLFLVSDRQTYTLRLLGSDRPLVYRPNLAWTLGAGFDYKWAGTELTLKLPFLGYNTTQKGRTKPFAVSLNYNNRRLWVSGQYQFYRGFYLANPNVLEPEWLAHHDTYPQRNDLISQTITTQAQYLFNPLRMSIPATLLQREGQRKPTGSWVIGGFLTYQHIHADSALVPTLLQSGFTDRGSARGERSIALGINAGYIQTFVFHNYYFINMSLRPGLSILYTQTAFTDKALAVRWQPGWQGLGSLTIGYSSPRYYGGIYASINLVNRAISQGFIHADTGYIRLVAGKRLRYRPKGLIKKLPGL